MTMYVPDFFPIPSGAADDFEVVKVHSNENNLSVTANDHSSYLDYWRFPPNVDIALPNVPVAISDSLFATPFWLKRPDVVSAIKILSVTTPKHGTVRIAEDRLSVFYTPDKGFEGVDQFDYVVEGESSGKNKATVNVNVVQPLLAVDDWFLSKPANTSLDLDVLKNDQFNASVFINDDFRQKFKIVAVTNPNQGGSARIAEDGRSLIYSAAAGFDGIEKLEYTLEDKDGYRDTAEVSIRLTQSTTASETVWPEQLQQQWLEEVVQRNIDQFGRGISAWGGYPIPLTMMDRGSGTLSVAAPGNASDSSSSHTNNQVSGVDEGDIVETDGRYLYVFTRHSTLTAVNSGVSVRIGAPDFAGLPLMNVESSELIVIDAMDPKSPKIVSQLAFSGRLVGQHVSGNRLVVLTESYGEDVKSTVTIVDIADRAAAKVVRSSVIDGSVSQSRLIGDKLYVFASAYLQVPNVKPHATEAGVAQFYETGRQFLARLGDNLFGETQIQVTNFDDAGRVVGTPINTLSIDGALAIIRGTGIALGIYAFDIDASQVGPFDIDMLESGYSPTIFVSSNAAYLFTTRWDLTEGIWGATQIVSYAFDSSNGTVSPSAKGSIAGSLLNSFSVGEHNGDLQVFSSVGMEGTRLSILRRDGQFLKEIGSVKNIAPGEQIYSARFAGDRAFAVTFRRVDPLYVFDLSNPTDPKIDGELKLPGYSQYLHLIDSTHLMGIGRNADEQTGMFGSLQVSLFDITDGKNIKLKSSYQFDGGRQTYSPLLASAFGLTDHHALGYFNESGILALPLTHYPDWSGTKNEDGTPKDDGLPEVGVLQIDTLTGIKVLGGVQSPTPIHRTVQFGEYLYSIASDRVIVTDLLAPSVRHAELLLPQPKPTVKKDDTNGTGNSGSNGTVVTQTGVKNDDPAKIGTTKRQWHNREIPCDVNGDGTIAPVDVLNVINFLKTHGNVALTEVEKLMAAGESAQSLAADTFFQVDVNGDGEITPIDVLIVINRLRSDSTSKGEGEATAPTAANADAALTSISTEWAVPDIENELRKRSR